MENLKSSDGKTVYSTDYIVCPWCGYEHENTWEMPDGEYECYDTDNCGKPFTVTSYTTREITSTRKEATNAKK
jgi:hypothetical protein